MRIIRKLPPAPKPTLPVRVIDQVDSSPLVGLVARVPTEQNKKNAWESRRRNIGVNKAKVLKMATEGVEYSTIAVRTGLKESSVRRMVRALRAEGHSIPERKRGRRWEK